MKHTFEQLNAIIATIAASENVTRKELGEFSRVALTYVLESEDVRPINTLLGKIDGVNVLTSVNRRTANLFFREFAPFADNGAKELETLVFTKKKAKVWDKYVTKIEAFLADEKNNIWTWANENIKLEAKAKDYAGKIKQLIEKALADEVEGITQEQLLQAVLDGGIEVDAIIKLAVQAQNPLGEAA
ncbi:MAG: hypothetical protein ACRCVU_13725 [Flavobacterium sp.]